MKNKLVLMMSLLLSMIVIACNNDDDIPSELCGTWTIIGYGNDQEFHTGDHIVNSTRLTFYSDGTFDGHIYPNEVTGKYKCNGNNFSFTEVFGTQLGAVDPDLQFIDFQIRMVNAYKILSGSELRLYYEEDNYIKFYKVG